MKDSERPLLFQASLRFPQKLIRAGSLSQRSVLIEEKV